MFHLAATAPQLGTKVRPVLGGHLPRGQAARGGAAVVGIRTPARLLRRPRPSRWMASSCDADSPTVTARARREPAVPDVVRTQDGLGYHAFDRLPF